MAASSPIAIAEGNPLSRGPTGQISMPRFLIPKSLHNEDHCAISLGDVVRWLAQQSEGLGVVIFS